MIYADHIVHAIASCQDAEQSSVTLLIAIDGSAARNLHQIRKQALASIADGSVVTPGWARDALVSALPLAETLIIMPDRPDKELTIMQWLRRRSYLSIVTVK